jgi:Flp pilus assembly protein TadD
VAYFQAGRYEQALQTLEQALLMNPDFVYSLKDKAVICEKLRLHEGARDAVRRLRAVDRSTTLEQIEAANTLGFISPETSADMNATFRKVWLETPLESPEP